MHRRRLLQVVLASAVAGTAGRHANASGLKVVVAGAGIVGASIAYHLSKAGASVTVIDKQGPASHASRGSFAWINATWAKQPRYYHSLSQASVTYWKELSDSLSIPVHWGGSLEWYTDAARQDTLVEQIAEQAEWGERARMVKAAELAEMEPGVNFGDIRHAAYSGNDGGVDSIAATQALLKAAEALGATQHYPCELNDTVLQNGKLVAVETSLGAIETDRLVLATGAAADAGRRFAGCDIPQRSTPGVIVITEPMERVLNGVLSAPGVHMHQRSDGRIVLGEQDGAPDTEAHATRLSGRPNDYPSRALALEHANRILAVARTFVPATADAVVDKVYIGWRPLPLDGHPVLGASPARPDVYLAIMHSGVSLAPIVGQLVSAELGNPSFADQLQHFRPDRKFDLIKRY